MPKPPFELDSPIIHISKSPVIVCSEDTSILDAADIMVSKGFRRLPVVAEDMTLKGILTATDIVDFAGGRRSALVKERFGGDLDRAMEAPVSLIYVKQVVSVLRRERIADAIDRMKRYAIGALPVVDEEGKVWAIVTERDILFSQLHRLPEEEVGAVMTKDVVTASPDASVEEACTIISSKGFRRLPIVSNGKLVGIATTMDIVRFLSEKYGSGLSSLLRITRLLDVGTREVYTIAPWAHLDEAASLMKARDVGALPVVEGEKLVGIITERDLFNLLG